MIIRHFFDLLCTAVEIQFNVLRSGLWKGEGDIDLMYSHSQVMKSECTQVEKVEARNCVVWYLSK
jgi:hypothetical protein